MSNTSMTFEASQEQMQAIINALSERFPIMKFWVTPTGEISKYKLNVEKRILGGSIHATTLAEIDRTVAFVLSVFAHFDKIMEGDDYGYETQKNFD